MSETWDWTLAARRHPQGREILRQLGRASIDFELIEAGDRILVACSGGKDSYTLLWAMERVRQRVPFTFEIVPLNIDMGFGQFEQAVIGDYIRNQGLDVELVQENAGMVIEKKIGQQGNACWLCARLRRGILYTQAKRLNCNKIALGHHADDSIETLLINQFFAGRIKAMPPKLRTDDGSLLVIRPLIYCYEATIRQFAADMKFPLVGCNCAYGSGLDDGQRLETKKLIEELSQRIPDLRSHLLASLTHVVPDHLMDRDLFDFKL